MKPIICRKYIRQVGLVGNKILFVFEGRKTEPKIFRNISKLFFSPANTPISYFYVFLGTNIYQLCNEVLEDPDLDLFVLLKQRSNVKQLVTNIGDTVKETESLRRDDFSEIYLFFDFENHDQNSNLSKLKELVTFFNNETDHGKLFINYPMVESLKDYNPSKAQYQRCLVNVSDNIHYKKSVGEYTGNAHFGQYNIELWEELILYFVNKANCLINSNFEKPEYEVYRNDFNQLTILRKQIEYWNGNVAFMLNSIPFFLIDYFGKDFYDSI